MLELVYEHKNIDQGEGGTGVCHQGPGVGPDGPGAPAASCPGAPSPLLVYNAITTQSPYDAPNGNTVDYRALTSNQKQGKRLFSALQSGLLWNKNKSMRFLTLTSGNDSPRDVMRSFNHLVTNIRRTKIAALVDNGYIPLVTFGHFYPDRQPDDTLTIDYLAMETTEGNGVIHALIIGDYLPQKWLSNEWKRIHCAWNVDIRAPRSSNKNLTFARYMLAQYIKGQNGIRRVNCSKNWVYPGWRADFKRLIRDSKAELGDKAGFDQAILTWTYLMGAHRRLVDLHRTITLSDYGFATSEALNEAIYAYTRQNYKEWLLNDAMQRHY